MNRKIQSVFLIAGAVLFIFVIVPLFSVADAGETGTLWIHSYPAGLEVYITDLSSLNGPLGETKWISEEYLVGKTPVEVPLDEGEYRIAVKNKESINVFSDGESTKLQVWTGETFLDETKCYHYVKPSGGGNILVALFWPKTMSVNDFLKTLPRKDFVVIADEQRSSFEEIFTKHNVPQSDWESLISMFQKTGKLAWHGKTESEYLYITATKLDEDRRPAEISIQPVIEFE